MRRRRFLSSLCVGAVMASRPGSIGATRHAGAETQTPVPPALRTAGAPRSFGVGVARLRYHSGDGDYNPKVAANVLDAVVQYTEIPVYQTEVIITADSAELTAFPFVFMTGHKLVRFSDKERQGLVRFVETGGLLFS